MSSEDTEEDGSDELETEVLDRCDFCRMPIPGPAVTTEMSDGATYAFCCEACRDQLAESDYVFTEYHGHRRIDPGVSALDASLRQGLPRNSFVLVSAEAGTRDREVHAELVWRTLQRGEPAVVVSFQEPPVTVVQQFLTLDWNVLPYLERDQLHILDCFTYRLQDRDRMFERMDQWNTYLSSIARGATTSIRDPSDLGEVGNKLDNALEELDMVDRGAVLVDSLTELGTLVQPVQAYNFVKDVRAEVCKGRFVPIFAGATLRRDADEFPHDLGYVVDGVVELRLNDELVEETLLKQARVRKSSGVLVVPEWHTYEYTAGLGMVRFDPREEAISGETRQASLDEVDDQGESEAETAADAEADDTEGTADAEADDAPATTDAGTDDAGATADAETDTETDADEGENGEEDG